MKVKFDYFRRTRVPLITGLAPFSLLSKVPEWMSDNIPYQIYAKVNK